MQESKSESWISPFDIPASSSTFCAVKESDAIFVAGHRGLAGGAILRELQGAGYGNLLTRSRDELDLRERETVRRFFAAERPAVVVLAAAKVGGIKANNDFPVEFLLENLRIQNNVIEAAHEFGAGQLLFLGSSCIYPKFAPQPIPESALLTGALEPTNDAYAIAKIAGIKLCQAYAREYGSNFIFGDADESLRTGRQLRSEQLARAASAAAQSSRSENAWRVRSRGLGNGHAAARIPPRG